MNREHNSTSAHLDLAAYAERTKIGRTFHQPAPQRITVRRPGRFLRALYALLIGLEL